MSISAIPARLPTTVRCASLHHYFNRLGEPSKRIILSRIGAYHGSTHLSVALTTPAYRADWNSAEDLVHHLSSPYPYRRPDGMTVDEFSDFLIQEMIEAIEKIGAENIAGFIAEPIMGAGGVIVPPDGYHKRTRDVCSTYGIKYISDEVVTAFGRLGHFFSSQDVFGIEPDIITSAKGLTSGYQPLSATILSEEIYDVIAAPGAMFLHGMTYSSHPAACAAALANIAIMRMKTCAGTSGPRDRCSRRRSIVLETLMPWAKSGAAISCRESSSSAIRPPGISMTRKWILAGAWRAMPRSAD